MAGSSLKFNLPDNQGNKHTSLNDRNAPLQHVLESIYRDADGKNLSDILNEMGERDMSVKWELIPVSEETDTVTLTNFQFNMARDELFVAIQGLDVYEGPDKDYIKISASQLKFNYILQPGYEVAVVLAGTKSNISFGDDIYNALNKFTQLTDTPQNYYGNGGKFIKVNESETGIVFGEAVANTSLVKIEYDAIVYSNTKLSRWIPFVKRGIIKGIKVIGSEGVQDFSFSVWTKVNGYWVYYSGIVNKILWDIMDIPFVDESGQDSIYVEIDNKGTQSTFTIQIFVVQ
jgi:hypothetical protein